MFNLFVQTDDDSNHVIENSVNLNKNPFLNVSLLEKIISTENNLIFIVNKENYDAFSNFETVGDDARCTYVCIDDQNINKFSDVSDLKNVLLFVESESLLFSNFLKIYKNVKGTIEFKFKELQYYDEEILKNELEQIAIVITELEKTDSSLIVKQVNGYRMKEKFNKFGETDFFVGLDGNVYRHPNFYYRQDKKGLICKIEDFIRIDDFYYHITQPHLICVMCETFYCDRDIYHNKVYTNEYKVPCKNSCKMNTLLTNISKKMLNNNMNKEILQLDDLDKIESFDANILYENFLNKTCICNNIKNSNFSKRIILESFDEKAIMMRKI